MSPVAWKPFVWPEVRAARPEEIRAIENDWGVTLPEDYKKAVTLYQGCTPEPGGIKVLDGATAVRVLQTVSANSSMPHYSVQKAYAALKEHAPPGLYPFASSIGGDYFCFDYRQASRSPRIIFFFPEEEGEDAIIPVADSFTQFLDDLKD